MCELHKGPCSGSDFRSDSEGQAQVTQEVLEDEGSDRTQDSDRSGDAFVLGSGAREVYTEAQAAAVAQTAQKLMEQQQYQHRMCERVIQMLPQNRHKQHRSVLKEERARYLSFGLYAYGNHYGVTKCTLKFPKTCQYLLQYLQHWSKEPLECTSFVINDNGTLHLHKDNHNRNGHLNSVIGVTAYQN